MSLPDELLDAIYDAPLQSSRWRDVYRLTHHLLDTQGIHLHGASDKDTGDHLKALIPDWWLHNAVEHNRQIQRWNNADFAQCSAAIFVQSPPSGKNEPGRDQRVLISRISNSNSAVETAMIAFNTQDDLRSEHSALLHSVHVHIHRAMRLCWSLQQQHYTQQTYVNALELLNTAVLLLDDQLQVIYINRAATDVLHQRDGILVQNRQFVVHGASTKQALQLLFQRALRTQQSGILGLTRPSGKHPFQITVQALPVQGELRSSLPAAQLMLLIVDPHRLFETDVEELAILHRLTPSEARVCVQLLGGNSLKRCASSLNISYETVRSHMKAVYRKVGVHTQAELLNVLRSGH